MVAGDRPMPWCRVVAYEVQDDAVVSSWSGHCVVGDGLWTTKVRHTIVTQVHSNTAARSLARSTRVHRWAAGDDSGEPAVITGWTWATATVATRPGRPLRLWPMRAVVGEQASPRTLAPIGAEFSSCEMSRTTRPGGSGSHNVTHPVDAQATSVRRRAHRFVVALPPVSSALRARPLDRSASSPRCAPRTTAWALWLITEQHQHSVRDDECRSRRSCWAPAGDGRLTAPGRNRARRRPAEGVRRRALVSASRPSLTPLLRRDHRLRDRRADGPPVSSAPGSLAAGDKP